MTEKQKPAEIPQTKAVSQKTFWQLFVAFGCFVLPVVAFAKIASDLRVRGGFATDAAILNWIHQFSSPFWDVFFMTATHFGEAWVVMLATLLGAGYLLYREKRRAATLMVFAVGGAGVLSIILKLVFQRVRPDLWPALVTETSYSFPSGHAMASGALIFGLIAILWPTRWRWYTVVFGLAFMGIVGVSRLYLGVHFPTDIVAGWLVSLVWVVIVKILIDQIKLRLKSWPKKTS